MNRLNQTLFFTHPKGRTFSVLISECLLGETGLLDYMWEAHPSDIAAGNTGIAAGLVYQSLVPTPDGSLQQTLDLIWVPRDQLVEFASNPPSPALCETLVRRARAHRSEACPNGHQVFASVLLPIGTTLEMLAQTADGTPLKLRGALQTYGAPAKGWSLRAFAAPPSALTR